MLAVLSIYLTGVVVCALAGVAVAGLTDPGGRWLGAPTIPVGLGATIALLYVLGLALPGSQAAPVALVLVLAGLGGAVWRLRRHAGAGPVPAALRGALRVTRGGAVALGAGVLAGVLLLLPTMRQGFATTISVSNNDGWGYASMVEWIKDHPVPRSVAPDIAHPLTLPPWSTLSNHFGIGFEHFAALLATLLSRDGYEVVNAAAAVAIAAGVGGWVMLAEDIDPRLGSLETALVAFAVAMPVLALPFTENYTTQFVSLCLWPLALSGFVRFSRAPGIGRLVVAALGTGAVVGVYPSVVPWLVLPLCAVAAMAPGQPSWAGGRLRGLAGGGGRARAGRAAALLLSLLVALMVVAPVSMVRGAKNLLYLDSVVAGGLNVFFRADGYLGYAVGAASGFSLFSITPLAWSAIAGVVLMLAVYALAMAPWPRPRGDRWLFLAIAAGVLVTTAVVFVRYRVQAELPYQTYKGLTSGAALFGGLVVLGLATAMGSAGHRVRLIAAGCLIAVWLPVTASLLQASKDGGTGFRAPDVQMGRALADLPAGSVVLAEGAAPDDHSFQLRMMASYFGSQAGLTTIGLGSTASYLTGGGGEEWRPAQPWTDVLSTRPQPIVTRRTPVWRNDVYTLTAAPPLDLTLFGTAWYPSETEGTTVFAWTAAAVQVVVANRSSRERDVTLRFRASSWGRPRTLTVSGPQGTVRRPLPADTSTPVSVDLRLPAGSATPITLDADPGATTGPPGDARQLMVRVDSLRLAAGPGR